MFYKYILDLIIKWRVIITVQVFYNDIPMNFFLEGDLAVDTETMGLNLNRDRLCVLQFSNGNGKAYIVHFTDQSFIAPNLKRLLEDPNRIIIFHYARFDLAVIKKYLQIDIKNVFCTKIASKLVRTYTDQHGLKELCRELLDISISKHQQCSYWGDSVLSNDQQEYAAKDVLYLHSLREILTKMLQKENRIAIANKIFNFLSTRVELDLIGWEHVDLFSFN